MPIKYVESELFLEHKGVEIFHVYKNDNVDEGRRIYWYTTEADGPECGDYAFDVRDLCSALRRSATPGLKEKFENLSADDSDNHDAIIRSALDEGLVKLFVV